MRPNPSDYFAYKKSKIQLDIEPTRRPMSRLNFLFQIFIATFKELIASLYFLLIIKVVAKIV